MLNNRVFVVENVDIFIEKIRAKIKNKGYTLSGPAKPLIHLHHKLDTYLSVIDMDFRHALYYHLQFLLNYNNVDTLKIDENIKQQMSNLTYEKNFTYKIDDINARL